jgi:hypothetical protein
MNRLPSMTSTIRRRSWVALAWTILGCSGSVDGGAAKRDASTAPGAGVTADGGAAKRDASKSTAPGAGFVAACDQYFAAQHSRCGGPHLPADETVRIRARFEQVCANQMTLPGSGVTVASLIACASALDVAACELPAGLPDICNFHGALPGGAACRDGLQCASGLCQGTQSFSPGGATGPVTCGACEPLVAVGQVCGHDTFSAGCPADAICLTKDTTSSLSTYTCTAVTKGDLGAACDDLAALCKPGLYCAAQTGQCARLGAAGARCGEGPTPPGWAGGCVAPLGCVGLPGASICGTGSAGAFCLTDSDCASELGCVPGPCSSTIARIGCSASGTCAPITWAAAGERCSETLVRCLVASCNFGSPFPVPRAEDGGVFSGTCPTVIPDGQPCKVNDSSATCDTFSECFEGKCALLDSAGCK